MDIGTGGILSITLNMTNLVNLVHTDIVVRHLRTEFAV